MPDAVADRLSIDAELCRTMTWGGYEVKDAEVLEDILAEHAQRRDEVDFPGGFSMREKYEDGERVHLFFVDDDGLKTQLYAYTDGDATFEAEAFVDEEVGRHETIAANRLNALVGRANKTVELAEYIERFEDYGVAETVLDEYREGPVLSGDWLERAILQEHDRATLEAIPDHLFTRPGEYTVEDEELYEDAVEQVTRGELYDESGAGVLDPEAVTKQRRLSDYYTDGSDGEAMRSIYDTVIDCVETYLERQ